MEELGKALIHALSEAPQLAIWALAIFYGFKVAVVGSIYGVIRYCVGRVCTMMETKKTEVKEIELRAKIDSMTITKDGSHDALIAQLDRVRGKGLGIESQYIHSASVRWLREAIDAKIEADLAAKEAVKRAIL